MKTFGGVLLAFLLQAQAATVKGTISVKDTSMPVADSVAVWDPAKGQLRIALLPFKIAGKAVTDIRKDRTMFAMFDQKSPDATKWADWCPGAEMTITFKNKDITKGPAGMESFSLWAYGLKQKNFTDNVGRTGLDVEKGFSKIDFKPDGKGGGTLEAVFARTEGKDDDVKWDIAVKCAVLAPLEKK
jgi:hypothetical protein